MPNTAMEVRPFVPMSFRVAESLCIEWCNEIAETYFADVIQSYRKDYDKRRLLEAYRQTEHLVGLRAFCLSDWQNGGYLPEWEVQEILVRLSIFLGKPYQYDEARPIGIRPKDLDTLRIVKFLERQFSACDDLSYETDEQLSDFAIRHDMAYEEMAILRLGRGIITDGSQSTFSKLLKLAKEEGEWIDWENSTRMLKKTICLENHLMQKVEALSQEVLSKTGVKWALDDLVSQALWDFVIRQTDEPY